MEDLKITIEDAPNLFASISDLDDPKISLAIGWECTFITKSQAKQLREWLIRASK